MTKVTECPIGLKYQYHGSNAADDWLFSPALSLSAGKEYKIKYWLKESNPNKEKFELYVGTTTNVSDYTEIIPLASFDKTIGTTWRHEEVSFVPESDGEYHFGFRACSEKNQYTLLLRGFSIKENVVMPNKPTDFVITPAPDKSLKATLNWVLPTVDDEGNALSKEITGVNIRRNGELIATLPGDATEYTDENVPEPGKYEYEVSALIDAVEGFGISSTSKWIGILTAQPLPFTENFSDPDFYETFWSTLDVNNDAKTNANSSYPPLSHAWCFMANPMKNAHWAVIYSARNSDITDDDWLFSAPLAFPAKGKYKVSFKASTYNGSSEYNVGIFAGKNNIPEEMTIEIGEVTTLTQSQMNPNTDGEPFEFEFNAHSAGAYYIGFHSQTTASSLEHQFRMGAFQVEVVELQEDAILVSPYSSSQDPNWADTDELTFALLPGYYHASWTTDGEVSVDDFNLDQDFSEEYAVLKVTEESKVVFKSTSNFTSFEILDVDHTPGDVEDFTYFKNNNGDIEFSFRAPSLNKAGSKLYEVEGATLYEGAVEIAQLDDIMPGEVKKYTHSNPTQMRTRADEDADYSVELHNMSGKSAPVSATLNSNTGINTIETAASESRLFNIDGTKAEKGSLIPGVYIEVKNGKATKVIVK